MRTTIDAAGRIVIPKAMRDAVGLRPGEVDVELSGAGIHIEAVTGGGGLERSASGRLVIPKTGVTITDDDVQRLRDAFQR